MHTDEIEIHGTCDEHFLPLKEAFLQNFMEGSEVGASIAVMLKGKLAVDLWGGYFDTSKTKQWQEDTILNVYSVTKIAAALCMHLLVDRKQLDLDAPIAQYWPEFGCAGKEKIPVRMILSHSTI